LCFECRHATGQSEVRFNGQGVVFLTPPCNVPVRRTFQWPEVCVFNVAGQRANREYVSMARDLRF
jgi:hypothetical protein